jgi:hypothetical protein
MIETQVKKKRNMTKKPLTELIGKIIFKEPKKVYDKDNPFYGNFNYRLKVLTEDQEIQAFFVYQNLVSSPL